MEWIRENWGQAVAFCLITPLCVWFLWAQIKMVDKVKKEDKKRGYR